MRAHFLVPLLALLLTSLLHADGKPLKEHGAEDESFAKEENNEVHESKDDEEIEEIGKRKSSIETELDKGRKDNDNKIDSDSESKTERLIDELSDNNSADERKRTGQVKNEVEELTQSSVDKKDDIVETNEENTDDENSEKKGEIETEDNADDASEVSDTRPAIVSEKADDDESPVKKDGVSERKGEDTKETDMEKVKVEKKSKAGKKSKTGSAARKRDEPECCHHEAEHEGEHCCHDGDACCHEAEHGHHEGKDLDNTHNNHDHGYEFYEEWGEHGGHEGEHETHHTGEDEGEHEHHHEGEHHGHHDHHDHDHEHENEHSEDKDSVPKRKDKVTTNTKKKEALPNSKKWWMVGDSKQWGGKGHDHWGPPEESEQEGWHGHGHGHGAHSEGHQKAHIPECCKTTTQKADKRCHCPHISHGDHHGEEGEGEGEQTVPGEHTEGYHFHERGHGGHNDHDHDLRGPWSFGYDGFGDDWPDWDHNQKEFEHLQELDRESHEGEHDGHDIPEGHHHTCKGHGHQRSCLLKGRYPGVGLVAPITPPMGGPLPYGMPLSLVTLPLPAPPAAHARHPYRVCHDCHILKNGGSRCLCKAIKHHAPVEQSTDYIHHVYIDCDAIVHNYPHGRKNHQVCFHRADIPTPEVASHAGGSKKVPKS